MTRARATGSEVEQSGGIIATDAIALKLAKKARSSSTVDTNKACSNRKSRENKYSNGTSESASRIWALIQSICYKGR